MENLLPQSIEKYKRYIMNCEAGPDGFKLTLNSEISPYALCFGIFGLNLINQKDYLEKNSPRYRDLLINNIKSKHSSLSGADLKINKGYLQLLCFTLSSMKILDVLEEEPLEEFIVPLMPENVKNDLVEMGALEGRPGSGNFAMFMAIILIHARDYLKIDCQQAIDEWVRLHLEFMNKNGFWGDQKRKNYVQFQNGYHQYEILNYLKIPLKRIDSAVKHILPLQDSTSQFAPYPGGSGCYDYDALSILINQSDDEIQKILPLFKKLFARILQDQNEDGGFCESRLLSGNKLSDSFRLLSHVITGNKSSMFERFKYFTYHILENQTRIHTHWTRYSRKWNESDLWDSWFRMQSLAVMQPVLYPELKMDWGFIDYPGIGFHPGKSP